MTIDHVFELTHMDNALGPMVIDRWLYSTLLGAMRGAQEFLSSEGREKRIVWTAHKDGSRTSQDLGDRQYIINRRIVLL